MRFEYPLQWLPQQKRTKNQQRARFGNHSASKAGKFLIDELERLGAKQCLITSNLMVKNDGGFYARQGKIEDAGIVVYFQLKGKSKAMACDKWDLPEHNIWALYKSIEAIRGLERWGGSDFLDGLFTGFTALPSPDDITIGIPLYFNDCENYSYTQKRYYQLAKELHPDCGGSEKEFLEMKRQFEQIKGE